MPDGRSEEDGTRLCSLVPRDRTRGNGHRLKHSKFCLNIRLFYCECGQTLAEVAQRAYGVSSLRGIQNLPGHGPEQPLGLLGKRRLCERVTGLLVNAA